MSTSYDSLFIEIRRNSTEVNRAVKIKSECKQLHKNSTLSLDLPCILLLLFSLQTNNQSRKGFSLHKYLWKSNFGLSTSFIGKISFPHGSRSSFFAKATEICQQVVMQLKFMVDISIDPNQIFSREQSLFEGNIQIHCVFIALPTTKAGKTITKFRFGRSH